MSENAITVVELSLGDAEARAHAPAVREWLLSLGVVQANAKRDDLWQPSEFRAGPNVLRAATEWGLHEAERANSGVDVTVGRKPYHPFENDEPPVCPKCGTAMADGDYSIERLGEWCEGSEPRVRCVGCGCEVLAGDWRGRFSYLVGNLAVEFHNWPPLREDFIAALRERLGPRTGVVVTHS